MSLTAADLEPKVYFNPPIYEWELTEGHIPEPFQITMTEEEMTRMLIEGLPTQTLEETTMRF